MKRYQYRFVIVDPQTKLEVTRTAYNDAGRDGFRWIRTDNGTTDGKPVAILVFERCYCWPFHPIP